MKKCLQGHLYPETLDHCPVCAKDGELLTIFKNVGETTTSSSRSPEFKKAAAKLTRKLEKTSHHLSKDMEKTIYLGGGENVQSRNVIGWLLQLDQGDNVQESFQLRNGEKVSIGRDVKNQICIGDNTISREHCSLECRNNEIIIHDGNSANGTIVDGKLVESCILNEDHIISLGKINLKIKLL